MKNPKDSYEKLDDANKQLAQELLTIKSSLGVYGIIGLNASRIEIGRTFFGHLQNQSLVNVVLGLSKVFEREEDYELCSIRGVFREAKQVPIRRVGACQSFVTKYGIPPSVTWSQDVDSVLTKLRPKIKSQMKRIRRVRNTRIAHMQQNAPKSGLPSIAVFEDLLSFAFDFHSFVSEAFIESHPHEILTDTRVQTSLKRVLEKIGITPAISKFPD